VVFIAYGPIIDTTNYWYRKTTDFVFIQFALLTLTHRTNNDDWRI